MNEKVCNTCKISKDVRKEFSIRHDGKPRLTCNKCRRESERKWDKYPKVPSLEGEEWRPVGGFEGIYEISNLGRLKSLERMVKQGDKDKIVYEQLMGIHLNKRTGYFEVNLTKSNELRIRTKLHRLIAQSFIPNTKNKCCVNHINSIRTDNRLENLEWVTHKENMEHAAKLGRMKNIPARRLTGFKNPKSKAVNQYTLDGLFVKTYGSINEAEREVSFGVKKVLAGLCKTAGGFLWKLA